jgi:hypothetical protein
MDETPMFAFVSNTHISIRKAISTINVVELVEKTKQLCVTNFGKK